MDLVYPNEPRLFRIALALAVIAWLVILLATLGTALIYIGLFFLFTIFAHSAFISYVKGNGIKVTRHQFPDLQAQLEACCRKLGVEEVPEMYVLRTDFFNALATRFLRRHYIVLYTDVVDALIARPGALSFYIGHELGHIHRNHIRWGWVLAPVLWLPVLGSALRRAEEYTCDRYGSACCEKDEDAVAALAAIVGGDTRWRDLDVATYVQQVNETGGFFMSLNELVGDYPWLSKRLAWVMALRRGTTPSFPRRSPLAAVLSVFVPSVPGGAVSLIMVVAVVGVLAAVAVPAYQDYVETAALASQANTELESQTNAELASQLSAYSAEPAPAASAASPEPVAALSPYATPENLSNVLVELAPLRDSVGNHYASNQSWPSDLTEMGFESSFLFSSYGELPVAVYEGGVIGVSVGTGASGEDAYFVMEPGVDETGEIQWYCYGQDVAAAVLPEMCR